MSDSEELRKVFYDCASRIEDGWKILLHANDSGCYDTDEYWVLRGPDGLLYEQEGSACSCYGIEDQWCPVESNLDALRATLAQEDKFGSRAEKRVGLRALIAKLEAEEELE